MQHLATENFIDIVVSSDISDLVGNSSNVQKIKDAYDVAIGDSRILTGCNVSWSGTDYTYNVSAGSYYIRGIRYTFAGGQVGLDAADATDARKDVIVVTTSQTATKVTGVANAPAQTPSVDPDTQLYLVDVDVPANSTTPTLDVTNIYLENAEWTATGSANVTVASTTNPRTGTKCVRFASAVTTNNVVFDKGSTFNRTGITIVDLWLKSEGTWPAAKSLRLRWRTSAGVVVGSTVIIDDGLFGFQSSVGGYQQVTVPMSSFNLPITAIVQQLEIFVNGSGAGITLELDDVTAQTGLPQSVAQAVIKTVEADSGQPFTSSGPNDHLLVHGEKGLYTRLNSNALYVGSIYPRGKVSLVDDTTIAVDATLGDVFDVTTSGNNVLGTPSGAVDGQPMVFRIKQGAGGNHAWTLDTGYRFGTALSGITPSTTESMIDHMAIRYDATDNKHDVLAFQPGYIG